MRTFSFILIRTLMKISISCLFLIVPCSILFLCDYFKIGFMKFQEVDCWVEHKKGYQSSSSSSSFFCFVLFPWSLHALPVSTLLRWVCSWNMRWRCSFKLNCLLRINLFLDDCVMQYVVKWMYYWFIQTVYKNPKWNKDYMFWECGSFSQPFTCNYLCCLIKIIYIWWMDSSLCIFKNKHWAFNSGVSWISWFICLSYHHM